MEHAVYASPAGYLLLSSEGPALTGLAFCGTSRPDCAVHTSVQPIRRAEQWLDAYFAGKAPAAAELCLKPEGTEFSRMVWELLLRIPYGECVSYGTLARELAALRGVERMSAQAVGGAVGRNPIGIIIPCHRVLGASGSLTGFSGGLSVKRYLLSLEGIPFHE